MAKAKLEQALAFLIFYDNIPCLNYGTEILMTGGEDPDNRRDMRFTGLSAEEAEFKARFQEILKLRRHEAFGEDFQLESSDPPLLKMTRSSEKGRLTALFNFSSQPVKVDGVQTYESILSSGDLWQEGDAQLTLAAYGYLIALEPRADR